MPGALPWKASLRIEQYYVAKLVGQQGKTIKSIRIYFECQVTIDQTNAPESSTVHVSGALQQNVRGCIAEVRAIMLRFDEGKVNPLPLFIRFPDYFAPAMLLRVDSENIASGLLQEHNNDVYAARNAAIQTKLDLMVEQGEAMVGVGDAAFNAGDR